MEFQIIVPSEQEVGTFSNLLTAWFSAHEFTLDFCVTLPPAQQEDDPGAVVPCPVVSRLKIPVTVIFTMLQVMNGIMTRYEDRFGPITRIGESDPQ